MRRGKVLERPAAQPYRAPDISERVADPNTPEGRVEEAVRVGFAQGFNRGKTEGEAALAAEAARRQQAAARALDELNALRREMVEHTRRQVIDLAVEIASRVVRERIDAGDPVAVRIAEELLGAAQQAGPRTVRVNPEDHAALMKLAPRLAEPDTITVTPDASVSPGGLIVEAAGEIVDARVETALAVVREAVEDPQ